jgi:hypothetical protein
MVNLPTSNRVSHFTIMTASEEHLAPISAKPLELSFPLPKAPQTRIHLRLTINATSLLLFLTTIDGGEGATNAALGSFVYALPDVSKVIMSLPTLAVNILGLISDPENPSGPNAFHSAVHIRIYHRLHKSFSQAPSKEDGHTSLCR